MRKKPMADEQPLQAHLRNKSAKEPSAKEAVQPNAAIAASGCETFRAAKAAKVNYSKDNNPL